VLIVGGGPAGAAAAIYTARKGFRTGVAAERFGGQLLDTLGIDNFISVKHTEGPKLARELEAHVADNGVDIMTLAEAAQLIPAKRAGGYHQVVLKNGAALSARAVVLATARAGATSACRANSSTATAVSPTARTATARCSRASAWRWSAAATRASRRPSTSP
jgi:alkyl hydroperoxide reductase subunit AhpF